jgi:hypothetical protein
MLAAAGNNQTLSTTAPAYNTMEPTTPAPQKAKKKHQAMTAPPLEVNTAIAHPLVNGEVIIDSSYPHVIVVGIWFRYPSLIKLQVVSLRTYLKPSSMKYVAVLNGWTSRGNKIFGRVANQLRVHSFPVRNKQLLSSYNHAFALNDIYYHLLHGNGMVQLRPGIDTHFIIDTQTCSWWLLLMFQNFNCGPRYKQEVAQVVWFNICGLIW